MELVVGASEATMKSLLGKLGGILAKEYTLIRGVNGDLQYINDELATMQSFIRTVSGSHVNDDLMKDWMKQIRDLTYDVEDCIDDSGHRLQGLPPGMCCYTLVNFLHDLLTGWSRRDVAAKISVLKMRAQQIGERRERYGVNNPENSKNSASAAVGFNPADNQQASLQLVAMKDPVGVEEHMGHLDKCVTCFVGFGGVGKTAIASALYRKFGDEFDHCAMVTVSQSSDLEAILTSIKNQVKPTVSNHQQQGGLEKNSLAAVVKGFSQGMSAIMAKCCRAGTSDKTRDRTKLDLLKTELAMHFGEKRGRR